MKGAFYDPFIWLNNPNNRFAEDCFDNNQQVFAMITAIEQWMNSSDMFIAIEDSWRQELESQDGDMQQAIDNYDPSQAYWLFIDRGASLDLNTLRKIISEHNLGDDVTIEFEGASLLIKFLAG